MNDAQMKQLLDACFLAKRITERMPPLPAGIKPRHIHVIASIAEHGENAVRVSDVSSALDVTTPSVTKLLNELEAAGAVRKEAGREDRRVVGLRLTELGESYYRTYVLEYHSRIMAALSSLSDEQIRTATQTIERLYRAVDQIAKEDAHERAR